MQMLCKSAGAESTAEKMNVTSRFVMKLHVLVHSSSQEEAAWSNDRGAGLKVARSDF